LVKVATVEQQGTTLEQVARTRFLTPSQVRFELTVATVELDQQSSPTQLLRLLARPHQGLQSETSWLSLVSSGPLVSELAQEALAISECQDEEETRSWVTVELMGQITPEVMPEEKALVVGPPVMLHLRPLEPEAMVRTAS